MYNTKFTSGSFNKKDAKLPKGYKAVIDESGNILCGINKKHICDLNGEKIASFSHFSKAKNQEGKELKVANYDSEEFGKFKFAGNNLYLANKVVGHTRESNKSSIRILITSIGLLLLTIAIILLIDTPDRSNQFEIDFDDEGTTYEETGKIGVFSPTIHPGVDGFFTFNIKNNENVKVQYSFEIDEYYNDELIEEFPIKYRLKMNNLYVVTAGEWMDGLDLQFIDLTLLARSNHDFTLEWIWEFESGNDVTDTLLGTENGEYSLMLKLTAQYYEED